MSEVVPIPKNYKPARKRPGEVILMVEAVTDMFERANSELTFKRQMWEGAETEQAFRDYLAQAATTKRLYAAAYRIGEANGVVLVPIYTEIESASIK